MAVTEDSSPNHRKDACRRLAIMAIAENSKTTIKQVYLTPT
jgi:hypothetical protein